MATKTYLKITHGAEQPQTIHDELFATNGDTDVQATRLANFFAAVGSGLRTAQIDVDIDDAGTLATDKAQGTATFVYATLAANDTEIIGGVTVTCVTGTPGAGEYKKETDLATTIANFAAMINAHATLSTLVTAAVTAVGVVTLTMIRPGIEGNFISTRSGVGTGVTWGAVALSSGGVSLQRTYKRGL